MATPVAGPGLSKREVSVISKISRFWAIEQSAIDDQPRCRAAGELRGRDVDGQHKVVAEHQEALRLRRDAAEQPVRERR
jgi:hypothetical protein